MIVQWSIWKLTRSNVFRTIYLKGLISKWLLILVVFRSFFSSPVISWIALLVANQIRTNKIVKFQIIMNNIIENSIKSKFKKIILNCKTLEIRKPFFILYLIPGVKNNLATTWLVKEYYCYMTTMVAEDCHIKNKEENY